MITNPQLELHMSEELHEITWTDTHTWRIPPRTNSYATGSQTDTHTWRIPREKIERDADPTRKLNPQYVKACREWLEANPKQGMTREEFNMLSNGTIVKRYDNECIKIGNQVARYEGRAFHLLDLSDHDLKRTTVVSTPPPPSLDSVRWVMDKYIDVWKRLGSDTWLSLDDGSEVSTAELLNQYGPPLTPLLPGPQIGGEA